MCFYVKIFCCCNCSAPQVVALAASLVQRDNHVASDVLGKVKFFIVKRRLCSALPIYGINYTVAVKD